MFVKAKAFVIRIWRAAPVATVILALALSASAIFATRATVFWLTRPPAAERFLPVAPWMTPRYVARSWHVPPKLVAEAIQAPMPPPKGPMSLSQIAQMRGVPVDQVIAEAQAAIDAFRAKREADHD